MRVFLGKSFEEVCLLERPGLLYLDLSRGALAVDEDAHVQVHFLDLAVERLAETVGLYGEHEVLLLQHVVDEGFDLVHEGLQHFVVVRAEAGELALGGEDFGDAVDALLSDGLAF